MTLEGAINFNETTDYIIYTMNSATTGQYGLVMPKNINGTLNMLVDLDMKGSFDSVSSGVKTKEQLVAEISEEYNKIKSKYVYGILVMPMIDEVMFRGAVVNNDKQRMIEEVKKIRAITSELYKKLTDAGIEKEKIDQKIIIVEKDQDDEKFVLWLKEQMPNFIEGIRYSELTTVQEVVNPFADSNNIFGPAVTETVPTETKVEEAAPSSPMSSGSIFDTPASIPTVAPISPVETVAPISPVEVVNPVSPVVTEESVVSNNVDIFGAPADVLSTQSVSEATVPSNNNIETQSNEVLPVEPTPVSTVEAPKPVESSSLEGTTTFSTISNTTVPPVSEEKIDGGDENTGKSVEHASKGFANLLILLVILVGVTFASIELGKFLYSVYGA